MKRPTHRQIVGKLAAAKEAVSCGRVALVNGSVVARDLLDLDLLIDDLTELLPRILDELNPDLYRGARPPQRSYEDTIKGCELYAFSWASQAIGCGLYFKFALKDDRLWIVSFHKDKKPKEVDQDELPK
jgi:hypothetical protein